MWKQPILFYYLKDCCELSEKLFFLTYIVTSSVDTWEIRFDFCISCSKTSVIKKKKISDNTWAQFAFFFWPDWRAGELTHSSFWWMTQWYMIQISFLCTDKCMLLKGPHICLYVVVGAKLNNLNLLGLFIVKWWSILFVISVIFTD